MSWPIHFHLSAEPSRVLRCSSTCSVSWSAAIGRGRREGEAELIADCLVQAKLADELGYGCWWTVEHHGCGDFSLSSSPEMFNALVSQHTERIRIGHSGVLAPYSINHPIRVAERAAFLDVVSGGRLEMGAAVPVIAKCATSVSTSTPCAGTCVSYSRCCRGCGTRPTSSGTATSSTSPRSTWCPNRCNGHTRRFGRCASAATRSRWQDAWVSALSAPRCSSRSAAWPPFGTCTATRSKHTESHVSPVVHDEFGVFTFVHCAASQGRGHPQPRRRSSPMVCERCAPCAEDAAQGHDRHVPQPRSRRVAHSLV